MVKIKRSEQFHKILKTLEGNFIAGFIGHLSDDTISFLEVDSEDSISFVSETKIMNEYNKNFKDKMSFESFYFGPDSDILWSKYRTKIKIGRYINRLLVDRKNKDDLDYKIKKYKEDNGLSDREFLHLDRYVEIFVNNYKALYRRAFNKELYSSIEFVEGEDIRYWYLEKNYLLYEVGSLGKYCMRHDKCQTFLNIYVDNPNICKLMIYKVDNRISMRALLWTLPDGSKYLDRVYANSEADGIIFMNYAKEKGWSLFDKNEATPDIYIKTPLIYEEYPYMDTFKYLDMNTHKYYSQSRRGTYELEGQEGEFDKVGSYDDDYDDDYDD